MSTEEMIDYLERNLPFEPTTNKQGAIIARLRAAEVLSAATYRAYNSAGAVGEHLIVDRSLADAVDYAMYKYENVGKI